HVGNETSLSIARAQDGLAFAARDGEVHLVAELDGIHGGTDGRLEGGFLGHVRPREAAALIDAPAALMRNDPIIRAPHDVLQSGWAFADSMAVSRCRFRPRLL